jgi:chromosome segregation ATPase
MFWEKKEDKKGLPELPPMKPYVSFGMSKKEEIPEEIPASPEETENYEEELPKLPDKFRFPRMEEPKKMTSEFTPAAKSEDVYVKIDRFHSARKALNGARAKLKEIDETMRKIRETRQREEQELSFWEKEIGSIKTKVEDVTKNIFEKIE